MVSEKFLHGINKSYRDKCLETVPDKWDFSGKEFEGPDCIPPDK
jgi:hypothetical protein